MSIEKKIALFDQHFSMMNLLVVSVALCTLTLSYTALMRVNLTLSGETSKRSSHGACMIILYVTVLAKSHIHVAKLHQCNIIC